MENTVAVHIGISAKSFGDQPAEPRYLKVVWGHGYKMERGLSEQTEHISSGEGSRRIPIYNRYALALFSFAAMMAGGISYDARGDLLYAEQWVINIGSPRVMMVGVVAAGLLSPYSPSRCSCSAFLGGKRRDSAELSFPGWEIAFRLICCLTLALLAYVPCSRACANRLPVLYKGWS